MTPHTVLGLDCSTKATGYAVFEGETLIAYGVIKPPGKDWRERLVGESEKLKEIIETYAPDEIVMEDVPLKRGGGLKIFVILGAVQGFVLGIANAYDIPITFLPPNTWRSRIGMYDGTQEGTHRDVLKQHAVEYANKQFGLNLRWVSKSSNKNDDDIAEAVLIAWSHIKPKKFGKAISHKGE